MGLEPIRKDTSAKWAREWFWSLSGKTQGRSGHKSGSGSHEERHKRDVDTRMFLEAMRKDRSQSGHQSGYGNNEERHKSGVGTRVRMEVMRNDTSLKWPPEWLWSE